MQIKRNPVWSTCGGLGPDLERESVVHGRAIHSKVSDFSNQLREFNKKKVFKRPTQQSQDFSDKQLSARTRAIEYARSLPRIKYQIHYHSILNASNPPCLTPLVEDRLESLLREHSLFDKTIKQIRFRYHERA